MADAPTAPRPIRRGYLAWTSLAASLLATPIYILLLDVPVFRSTALPAFALFGLGAVGGILAARRDRRWWVRGIAALTVLFLGAFSYAFFGFARLPAPTSTGSSLAVAPDFALPDHTGAEVRLSAARAERPVLLAFYRGWW